MTTERQQVVDAANAAAAGIAPDAIDRRAAALAALQDVESIAGCPVLQRDPGRGVIIVATPEGTVVPVEGETEAQRIWEWLIRWDAAAGDVLEDGTPAGAWV